MDAQKKEVTEAVGKRIKFFRQIRAMSQEELAYQAKLNPAYFGQVERGMKCPTVDTLCKIAAALNIPPWELLRFDSPFTAPVDDSLRMKELLARVPADKLEQVYKVIENIAELF